MVPVVCRGLPGSVTIIPKEARLAPYLYSRAMVASFIPPKEHSFSDPSDSIPLRKLRNLLFGITKRDLFRDYAKNFFLDLFQKYSVKKSDRFFFPSASYYDILGFVDACSSVDAESRPNCHFRMIGVMETSGPWANWESNYQFISRILRSATKTLGKGVSISAETGKYARKLTLDTGNAVSITPYPLEREPVLRDGVQRDTFTVISPGSAREDKGFYRLRNIIARLYKLAPHVKIQFLIQNLSDSSLLKNPDAQDYTARLQALPGVKLLSGRLENAEIEQLYMNADAIIMPYDANTYKFRGSAIFMEAIAYNLPIITTEGTGFAELVKVYCNGTLCKSDEEFSEAVLKTLRDSRHKVSDQPVGALRYKSDVESAFANIWRS